MTFKGTDSLFSTLFSKDPLLKSYFIVCFILMFSTFFYLFLSKNVVINSKSKNNLNSFNSSNKFLNLKDYLLEKYQSPYKKMNYTIQNNDSVEKILVKQNVKYN